MEEEVVPVLDASDVRLAVEVTVEVRLAVEVALEVPLPSAPAQLPRMTMPYLVDPAEVHVAP